VNAPTVKPMEIELPDEVVTKIKPVRKKREPKVVPSVTETVEENTDKESNKNISLPELEKPDEKVQKKIDKPKPKKSAAKKQAGTKHADLMREQGKGIFAPKTLSPELQELCGKNKMARTDVVKEIWKYIKLNQLNQGRIITPDNKLGKVFQKERFDMMEIPKMLFQHLSD